MPRVIKAIKRMHHPIFENFEILTSSEISPEFHYEFLGEVRRKTFDDGLAAVLGLPTVIYAPGEIRRGAYPGLDDDYFGRIDVLETVIAATESFTMVELGAGYGRGRTNAFSLVENSTFAITGLTQTNMS
jgi:hypothetical protein